MWIAHFDCIRLDGIWECGSRRQDHNYVHLFMQSGNLSAKPFSPKGARYLFFLKECVEPDAVYLVLWDRREYVLATQCTCVQTALSHQSSCSASVTRSHLLLSEPWLFVPDLNSGALYLYVLSELHCHVIQSPIQHCLWLKNCCIQNWVADIENVLCYFLG